MFGGDVMLVLVLGLVASCLFWGPSSAATTLTIPNDNSELLGLREYMYVGADNREWNRAQSICREHFQGFLATVNSQTVLNLLDNYVNTVWSSHAGDAWIGLHRHGGTGGQLTWDDPSCQSGNFTGFNPFSDSSQAADLGGEHCYVHKKGPPGTFERKACDSSQPFICERLVTGCSFETIPAEMIWMAESPASESVCRHNCDLLQGCLLTNAFAQSCVFLVVPPPGSTYASYKRTCSNMGTLKTSSYSTSASSSKTPTSCQVRQPGYALTVAGLKANASSISFDCPTTAPPTTCPTLPTPEPCSSQVTTVTAVSQVHIPCSTSTVVSSYPYGVTTTVTDVSSHPPETTTVTQTTSVVISSCDVKTPASSTTHVTSECQITSVTVTETPSPIMVTATVTRSVDQPVISVHTVTVTATVTESASVADFTKAATATLESGVSMFSSAGAVQISATPETTPIDVKSALTSQNVREQSSDSLSSTYGTSVEVVCQTVETGQINPIEAQIMAESLESELKVPTNTLSRTIRTKTSAPDPRVSSKVLGYGSLLLVVVPFALIIIADIPKIYKDFGRLRKAKEPREQ